ncbi:uncharacterized protein LOC113489338 [Athene cunicularia]|uniref:uncharacterized protein LOC113489338 n=1 Tax=Athene cunicularia TaxID=194338 RepID=UPI000EF64DFD|nr:uncharacterized protein LOC113489338 [Athene cunicularia]
MVTELCGGACLDHNLVRGGDSHSPPQTWLRKGGVFPAQEGSAEHMCRSSLSEPTFVCCEAVLRCGTLHLKQMGPCLSPDTSSRSKVMPGSFCSQGWVGVGLSLQVGFQGACPALGKPDHPLEGLQRAVRDLAADVGSLVEGLTLHGDLVWEAGKGVSQGLEESLALSCDSPLGISLPGSGAVPALSVAVRHCGTRGDLAVWLLALCLPQPCASRLSHAVATLSFAFHCARPLPKPVACLAREQEQPPAQGQCGTGPLPCWAPACRGWREDPALAPARRDMRAWGRPRSPGPLATGAGAWLPWDWEFIFSIANGAMGCPSPPPQQEGFVQGCPNETRPTSYSFLKGAV